MGMETEDRTHTRWPLPQRSATDRKLAGVAGGLGRAWRVDPILIRVAFVVLTLFGGVGIALYCAGWLLMRGDGDEASALEALAGRGHSSVSPVLAVVLIVVALGSMGSVFSWGVPFWPVLIGAIVLIAVLSRRGPAFGHPGRPWHGGRPWSEGRRDAARWADDVAARASQWGQEFGERASRWGTEFGERADGWFGRGYGPRQPSATDAAGSAGTAGTGTAGTGTAAQSVAGTEAAGRTEAVADTAASASAPAEAAAPAAPPEPEDLLTDGRTPPAWDPLGAAPFAWDLPDPTAPQAAVAAETPTRRSPKPGSAVARIALGLALIAGSLLTAGVVTHRLGLSWSVVTGVTLSILALGMLIAALRGRGARVLIGPGIFLAVLTLALTVTGLQGTSGFGGHTWTPTSAAEAESHYVWNAGDATLDLSGLRVPAGETVSTQITVGAGRATVILPADVTVHGQCSATAGDVDCLGRLDDGVRPSVTVDRPGSSTAGTLDITVHSNAGQAVLTSHE